MGLCYLMLTGYPSSVYIEFHNALICAICTNPNESFLACPLARNPTITGDGLPGGILSRKPKVRKLGDSLPGCDHMGGEPLCNRRIGHQDSPLRVVTQAEGDRTFH